MYSWWGHIGLAIQDSKNGSEYIYDFGNFSFEAKDFFTNFAKGRLWFLALRLPFTPYVENMTESDRDIHLYKLNLGIEKKKAMQSFLEWNRQKENRQYLYHHYRDNCATRIRDLLNDLTDGQLLEATDLPSGKTLRELTRQGSRPYFFGDILISFLLSGVNDKPVTIWDEMFLPGYLERTVLSFSYTNEAGTVLPLVAEKMILHTSSIFKPVPVEPAFPVWYRGILAGLLFAFPAILLIMLRRKTLFDIYRMAFLCIAGIPGSILFFMMFFSDHDVTYGNWNILILSPLCFLIVPLTILIWKKKGKVLKDGTRLSDVMMRIFCHTLCGLTLVSFLASRIPRWKQDNLLIVAVMALPYLSFCLRERKKT